MPPSRSTRCAVPSATSERVPPIGVRAFGGHDDAEARAPALALANALRDLLEVERNLRNQHDVGAAGQARVERDPARVAAHHFDDHHAVVRLRRRVQPIDRVGRERHRRIESERHRRLDDVVVDRLGHADDGHAALVKLVGDGERAVAADDDERVESERAEVLDARGRSSRPTRRASRRDRRTDCRGWSCRESCRRAAGCR